jgi:transcriptional regulator with GAF, ATPase, and Fis domain
MDLEGTVLHEAPLSPDLQRPMPTTQTATSLEDVERLHILNVLKTTGGVVEGARGAATILGLHPNTLRSRMKKLGIRPSSQAS